MGILEILDEASVTPWEDLESTGFTSETVPRALRLIPGKTIEVWGGWMNFLVRHPSILNHPYRPSRDLNL